MRISWRVIVDCASASVVASVLLVFAGSAAATLPDNRTFEMVSPVEKGGLSFLPNFAVPDASGDHVVVDGGSKNALLSSGVSWMLETRTPAGWSGVQIGPSPAGEANFKQQSHVSFNWASEDFSRFAFQTWMPLDPRDSINGMGEYVRNGPTGPFEWVSGPPAPAVPISEPGECEEGLEPFFCTTNAAVFAGASANLETVVWGEFHPLVAPPASLAGYPADTHEHGYEVYQSVGRVDELAGLVPAGSERECSGGGCVVPVCGAAMGNAGGAAPSGFAPVAGAVSGDGAEVVFTSPDPVPYEERAPGCTAPEVYVRKEGITTLDVSASEREVADPSGSQEKVYAGSSEEHERINTVFFVSKEELTDEANTGGADEGKDLYAYTMPTLSQAGVLTDLTPENNTPRSGGAVELTYLGASRNGEMVYFTASSVLTAQPNSHGEAAQSGVSNLYVYDASTGLTTFIAPGNGIAGLHTGLKHGSAETSRLTSQVTPDGQHLVFVSSERLTEYDNFGPECSGRQVEGVPVRTPGPCAEAYLYTAGTGGLVCVSCNPSGAPPVGSARLPQLFLEGVLDNNLEPGTLPAPLAVSADGSRVFFSSPDRLTTEAPPPATTTGSQAGIAINWEYEPNVYEYEKESLHLIAPAAALLTVTPSGNDVLFYTYDQLVPQDSDGLTDVYDARVDGGFPVLAPPACSGSSCQGTPAPPTIFATPPTATFTGVGNYPPTLEPKPKSCKKSFVLRKKKCVKKAKRRKAKKATHGKATHGKATRGRAARGKGRGR